MVNESNSLPTANSGFYYVVDKFDDRAGVSQIHYPQQTLVTLAPIHNQSIFSVYAWSMHNAATK